MKALALALVFASPALAQAQTTCDSLFAARAKEEGRKITWVKKLPEDYNLIDMYELRTVDPDVDGSQKWLVITRPEWQGGDCEIKSLVVASFATES